METATGRPALLSDEELEELGALGHRVTYPPGSMLVREGESTTFVVYLESGHVKVITGHPPAIVRICGPGSVAGERAATVGRPRSAHLVTLSRVDALMVAGDDWQRFLRERPTVLMRLYRDVLDRLEPRDPPKESSVTHSEFKVATGLIRLLEYDLGVAQGAGYRIAGITQRELGYLVGLSRESVSAALKSLRSQGVVETGRSSFRILDLAAIERIASRNYPSSEPL